MPRQFTPTKAQLDAARAAFRATGVRDPSDQQLRLAALISARASGAPARAETIENPDEYGLAEGHLFAASEDESRDPAELRRIEKALEILGRPAFPLKIEQTPDNVEKALAFLDVVAADTSRRSDQRTRAARAAAVLREDVDIEERPIAAKVAVSRKDQPTMPKKPDPIVTAAAETILAFRRTRGREPTQAEAIEIVENERRNPGRAALDRAALARAFATTAANGAPSTNAGTRQVFDGRVRPRR